MKLMALRRSSPQVLSFPGEEARESWQYGAEGAWKRAADAAGGVMGVEAMAFDSAPFWSLTAAGADDEAVALRWEALGVVNEGEARLWTHWPVTRKEARVLVGTLALVAGAALPDGETHEPSARMLPLPDEGMAVWMELGRYVVAFTREAKLVHLAVLSARSLDAEAAFEVRDLAAALRVHGFIQEVPVIQVWTRSETDFAPQLACLFEEAAVSKAARPDPRLPAEASGLVPEQVATLRQKQQVRLNQVLVLAAAAMVYLCFFGAWWLRLQGRESQVQRAETELASVQPQMERVREAQAHWQEMEPAINPDLYPVELFHQIVSLLPDEGIRLKEFQIEGDRLVLSGEATTVNQALGFKDRLMVSEPLQRYAWNFPVPSIREDNRAEFRAEGTLNGGGTHEGQ